MNRYAVRHSDLLHWMEEHSFPRYRADQLWRGLFIERQPLEQISSLPTDLRGLIAESFPLALRPLRCAASSDGTQKWLSEIMGAHQIETVLMPSKSRATVCISTQAGCAMGCTFCATGQAGFERQLTSDEMLEQVMMASQHAAVPVTHVVLMGMGEPLANYSNVVELLHRLHDDLGMSARRLTVSTVGIVPAMKKLAHDAPPVTLAVSLHAATDEARSTLIPLNRKYPIAAIIDAAREFSQVRGRRVTFEYTAIAGVNDSDSDAHALGTLLESFEGAGGAHVNLIPLNPTQDFSGSPSGHARLDAYVSILQTYGVTATVRRARGADIDAACGQLRATNGLPRSKSSAANSR
ncbi:MAG: 23S rRNA (adenine(2503)-C(2))-methyltransferase RlmN [Acidimicrobiia bacterium]